jgi:uncharacterized protein (TIGR03545 family)
MIKAKGFIISGIVLAIVVVFCALLMNPLVKWAMVAGGEKIFGAKVEIASVKIDVLRSKAVITGITVADKTKEFKNLFEAESITAGFEAPKLFLRKVIIDKIEALNIAAGTDRKTSGFLPKHLIKKDDKNSGLSGLLDKNLGDRAKQESQPLPAVAIEDTAGKLKNGGIKQAIKKEDLLAYKKIQEEEAGIKAEKDRTTASISAIKIDDRINSIKTSAAAMKDIKVSSLQDVPAAKDKLAELGKMKDDLDAVNKSVQDARSSAQGFADYSKNALAEIDKAKQQDINNVMKNSGVNILDAGSIEKALIGPVWYGRVQKALEIAALARRYMPAAKKNGKKKAVLEKKNGEGRDIVFIADLPDFWIKEINISTRGASDKYMVTGNIKDMTTEQAAVGRPLTFNLAMEKGGVKFGLEGVINHLEGINDSYVLYGKNLPPSMNGMKDTSYGSVKMKGADMDTEARVTSTDAELSVKGTAGLKNIKYETQDKNNITYQVLSGIDALKIIFEVKQRDSGPAISVTSDIMDRINKGLNKIYGSKVAEAKEKAKKEIDGVLKNETQGLTKQIGDSNSAIGSLVKQDDSKVSSAGSAIDSAKTGINKKISGAAGGGALKGIFGK